MSSGDLFHQINNAVFDLQSADLQSYERPLRRLASLLRHPDLTSFNDALVRGLSLEAFLEESAKTQGGMVGSAKLLWPDDAKETLGLTLLMILKCADDQNFMMQLSHNYFYSGTRIMNGINAVTRQLIIPFIRDYRDHVTSRDNPSPRLIMPLSDRIFIVHGHDEGAREAVARFLEHLGLKPVILHEQANKGRTVIEKVEANSHVSFAVVLLTPDDEGSIKGGTPEPRARQNVLLELGYFIGRLGRERVCALKRGTVNIPSDFAGVVWETMDGANGWKLALARELKAAGHPIDLNKVLQ